jgi:hypothetical protein
MTVLLTFAADNNQDQQTSRIHLECFKDPTTASASVVWLGLAALKWDHTCDASNRSFPNIEYAQGSKQAVFSCDAHPNHEVHTVSMGPPIENAIFCDLLKPGHSNCGKHAMLKVPFKVKVMI